MNNNFAIIQRQLDVRKTRMCKHSVKYTHVSVILQTIKFIHMWLSTQKFNLKTAKVQVATFNWSLELDTVIMQFPRASQHASQFSNISMCTPLWVSAIILSSSSYVKINWKNLMLRYYNAITCFHNVFFSLLARRCEQQRLQFCHDVCDDF